MNTFGTKNFLVPSSGTTHGVSFNQVFNASPYTIDWRLFTNDNFPFIPQGVFIDNTNSTGDLQITINPIGYNIVCKAGAVGQFSFPSPDNLTCTIIGGGAANLIFVDFPVFNFSSVNVFSGTVKIDPSQVPLPVNISNSTFGVSIVPSTATSYYLSLTTALSASVTPINTNLRKLILSISSNSAMSAAGLNSVSVTLAGNVIFKQSIYIPTSGFAGLFETISFENETISSNSQSLTLSVSTALTSGIIELNSFFS